jgi:hypothetical protein
MKKCEFIFNSLKIIWLLLIGSINGNRILLKPKQSTDENGSSNENTFIRDIDSIEDLTKSRQEKFDDNDNIYKFLWRTESENCSLSFLFIRFISLSVLGSNWCWLVWASSKENPKSLMKNNKQINKKLNQNDEIHKNSGWDQLRENLCCMWKEAYFWKKKFCLFEKSWLWGEFEKETNLAASQKNSQTVNWEERTKEMEIRNMRINKRTKSWKPC